MLLVLPLLLLLFGLAAGILPVLLPDLLAFLLIFCKCLSLAKVPTRSDDEAKAEEVVVRGRADAALLVLSVAAWLFAGDCPDNSFVPIPCKWP